MRGLRYGGIGAPLLYPLGGCGRYGSAAVYNGSMRYLHGTAIFIALALACGTCRADDEAPRQWGAETLATIQRDFWLPDRGLYADKVEAGKTGRRGPAFTWGCGVQLTALTAAARLDSATYLPRLRDFLRGLRGYWTEHDGIGGFDVLPGPKPPDRYYDDNAWMTLGLLEAYERTRDPALLQWAADTHRFVMSGEDDKLGGGLYWHEQDRRTKNTCVSGPATVGALRLYQLTRKPEYLAQARRLYAWTNAHLQDTDGLYWDHIALDGTVNKTKWSYNTALMLRANCLFHALTGEKAYLDEAERIAKAAQARWVDPATGGIKDGGPFAHHLCEAFLALNDEDRDAAWLRTVRRALDFVHGQVRDANGHYGTRWDRSAAAPLTTFSLLDQASAARAYWAFAAYVP